MQMKCAVCKQEFVEGDIVIEETSFGIVKPLVHRYCYGKNSIIHIGVVIGGSISYVKEGDPDARC